MERSPLRLDPLPGGGIRAFAPAKVNLFLDILGVRRDGYHEIDTIMESVTLFDEVEVHPVPHEVMRLEVVGEEGERLDLGPVEDNLVIKAARVLRSRSASERARGGLSIRLLKRIPTGAGLGGGSSDAAATLLALDRLWDLRLPREALAEAAARLGSDVSFFIWGGTARCSGRGEVVEPLLPPRREPAHYVLLTPPLHISTSLIYSELDRMEGVSPGLTRQSRLATMCPVSIWEALGRRELYTNRLEPVALKAFPELGAYLNAIQGEPFRAALMSGSGSTVFGVCGSREEADAIAARLRRKVRGRIFVVESVI